MYRKFQAQLIPIPTTFEKIFRECTFCQKIEVYPQDKIDLLIRMGDGDFYCPDCIKNNYVGNSHILGFSLRSMIGFYYQELYLNHQMRFCSILDKIVAHEAAGRECPVLTYDPDTFMWFANFTKIDKERKNISLEEFYKYLNQIFTALTIPSCVEAAAYYQGVFKKAIETFYNDRSRPDNRKFLIPTFNGAKKNSNLFLRKDLILINS